MMRRVRALKYFAETVQDVGAAKYLSWWDLIHLLKTAKGTRKLIRAEMPAQSHFAAHVFQVSPLSQTNARCRAGTHSRWPRSGNRAARRTADSQ
jgi:hypothetical protein